jgi:hypothetical protein
MTTAAFSYYRLIAKAHEARCAEASARYDLACASADIVSPWRKQRADNVTMIEDWLAGQRLKDRTPVTLALDWLAWVGVIDHGARPKVIPFPAAALERVALLES